MLTVDQITEVRLRLERGESIRSIAKSTGLNRRTITKIKKTGNTEFTYKKRKSLSLIPAKYIEKLNEYLVNNESLPPRSKLTLTNIYKLLQNCGYTGSYCTISRYAKKWQKDNIKIDAFVPQVFDIGKSAQFDWSTEKINFCGKITAVYVAHFRLCYSRMRFAMAFPKMTMEMMFSAHIEAHDFFGGLTSSIIYDNLKTVVLGIKRGKERIFNDKFKQLSSHYLFEIVACTPASGWEKGQVEKQVNDLRRSIFNRNIQYSSFDELNENIKDFLIQDAHVAKHPDIKDKTVWEVYQEEKPLLRTQKHQFDGCIIEERRSTKECLIQYETNYYSVPCQYASRNVTLRVYASEIIIAVNGEAVASHKRSFLRNQRILDFMHYVPLLSRKPGALRNGEPFKNGMPISLTKFWNALEKQKNGEKMMVSILTSIKHYGLEEVCAACEIALEKKMYSDVVILNYLNRLFEEITPNQIEAPKELQVKDPPKENCNAYNKLLKGGAKCFVSNF